MVKFRHAKMHVHHSDIFTSDKKANRHLASREHKDTVFRIIFRDKKKLLQLYNALNDSQYEDEQDLMVTTLDSVIYLSYKNDTSFLLDHVMFLGEHQASWNNNMPLRGMFYFARLYQEYVDACGNGYKVCCHNGYRPMPGGEHTGEGINGLPKGGY